MAIYRRLAEGTPAPAIAVAVRAGMAPNEAEEAIGSWPGVHRDVSSDVVGFWGLTIERLVPTHRLVADGNELFAWCAWDTLFLPALLESEIAVESTCPVTKQAISLRVSSAGVVDRSHPGAVVSFLVPERVLGADVIESFCHFVHFFATREAGERWTGEHGGTFLLSLDEAFELGRLVNARNFPALMAGTS